MSNARYAKKGSILIYDDATLNTTLFLNDGKVIDATQDIDSNANSTTQIRVLEYKTWANLSTLAVLNENDAVPYKVLKDAKAAVLALEDGTNPLERLIMNPDSQTDWTGTTSDEMDDLVSDNVFTGTVADTSYLVADQFTAANENQWYFFHNLGTANWTVATASTQEPGANLSDNIYDMNKVLSASFTMEPNENCWLRYSAGKFYPFTANCTFNA